jgi:hypothetical protein
MSVSIHTYALPVFWLDSSNVAVSLLQIADGSFLAVSSMIGGPELAGWSPSRKRQVTDASRPKGVLGEGPLNDKPVTRRRARHYSRNRN